MKNLRVLMAAMAAGSVFAVPTADFTQTSGKIRRELHSSGFGPMVCSCPQESIDAIKSMNFLNARTHDWALINPAERVCDYYHIFPLMHLDATDPKNYHFGPTDYLLKRTREETGLGVFFRLGTSIEHSGTKVHFNSLIPEDFDKVAETFAGTVRHYNKGWANGFNWNIQYWEIWNEPDGTHNMWCEPGGDKPENEARRRAKFVTFFVTVLKRLKSEFPEAKVGGPALCWMNAAYFKELLKACKEAGVAPDFISWHSYSNDPDAIMRAADDARKICDSFGFTKCELIIDEWHYFGNYTWGELRSPDPKVQDRVLDGPRSHNGIEAAAFTLATLVKFQSSKYDQAYYYGCRHNGSWGFKDYREQKYKTYYALKMFGGLAKDYSVISPVSGAAKGDPTVFAVKSADGAKSALLVVDYKGKSRTLTVNVKGVAGKKAVAKVLDHKRNIESCAADLQGETLKLEKADDNSAAFLVTFCDATRTGVQADQSLAGAVGSASRTAKVDFGSASGKINKWLHCAGYGPRSYPRSLENDDEDLKALHLTAARTHDWALWNNGQRVIDTQYLFPLMNKNPSDPANYVFEPTDHVLELAQNIGMKVFYRLGTSIEHTGDWAFNALNPQNHEQYAEALAGIVRHYTQGWGNGFKWDIQNWEIYNEPNIKPCWRGTKAEFLDLYVTALKRLKKEFPHLSIGGPAFAGCPTDYMKDLLAACKAAGVAPDFMSWHYYGQNPADLVAQPAKVRKLLDDMGFPKCRTIINEWHYIVSWDGIHGASSVDKIRKAHSGPSAHNGIDSAVFNLAVLAGFQNTCLDQSYYYGSGARGNWGYKDGLGLYNKCWYSLKMFGDVVAGYTDKVAATSPAQSVTVFAAKSADGKKGCLLVADYRGSGRLSVDVAGVAHPKNVKAVVLDHTRDLEPVAVDWKDGRLSLPRKDDNSVAFLVTFDL